MAAIITIIVVTVLSILLTDELKAWLRWITNLLIELAVANLPESSREHYREEWHSHVNEFPGKIGKLIAAISLLWASHKMSPLLNEEDNLEEITQKWWQHASLKEKLMPSPYEGQKHLNLAAKFNWWVEFIFSLVYWFSSELLILGALMLLVGIFLVQVLPSTNNKYQFALYYGIEAFIWLAVSYTQSYYSGIARREAYKQSLKTH